MLFQVKGTLNQWDASYIFLILRYDRSKHFLIHTLLFLQRHGFYSVAQNKIHFFYSVTANKYDWLFIILLFDNFSFDSR